MIANALMALDCDLMAIDCKRTDDPCLVLIGCAGASLEKQLDYMNYMEGMASNLPRVMYVHGAGQEIINFDAMV